jgi:Frag1/DRAM/Sfk1 family
MSLYLGYAWIPLFSGLVFLGGLIAMLAAWTAEGHPQYQPTESSIVFISDVGAHLKPVFISISLSLKDDSDLVAICAITAPGFVLSQGVDRFLRHQGRLAPNNQKKEKWMSWISILFSTLAGIALILLSIFDVKSQMKRE